MRTKETSWALQEFSKRKAPPPWPEGAKGDYLGLEIQKRMES